MLDQGRTYVGAVAMGGLALLVLLLVEHWTTSLQRQAACPGLLHEAACLVLLVHLFLDARGVRGIILDLLEPPLLAQGRGYCHFALVRLTPLLLAGQGLEPAGYLLLDAGILSGVPRRLLLQLAMHGLHTPLHGHEHVRAGREHDWPGRWCHHRRQHRLPVGVRGGGLLCSSNLLRGGEGGRVWYDTLALLVPPFNIHIVRFVGHRLDLWVSPCRYNLTWTHGGGDRPKLNRPD